jgi:hypothetical protein
MLNAPLLFHRFDNLDLLLQEGIHHIAERHAFIGSPFGQKSVYVGVQVDGQSKFSIGPENVPSLAFTEILFGFHACGRIVPNFHPGGLLADIKRTRPCSAVNHSKV